MSQRIIAFASVDEEHYRIVRRNDGEISIDRRVDDMFVWVGDGKWHSEGRIYDCPANLSEEVYVALENALSDKISESF